MRKSAEKKKNSLIGKERFYSSTKTKRDPEAYLTHLDAISPSNSVCPESNALKPILIPVSPSQGKVLTIGLIIQTRIMASLLTPSVIYLLSTQSINKNCQLWFQDISALS